MRPIPLNALAKLLGLENASQALVMGAAIDSRKVQAGDLFFALPGNRTDGHQFLAEAKKRGAAGAVVQDDYRGDAYSLPLLRVSDVLLALQDLARKQLKKRKCKTVAITGSLGKTTTKEFAATFLKTFYRVWASPLSYNTQSTVPLSILMSDELEDVLLLEMGMTHPGQIEKLISIAPPDIALLTTVALQHVNNFPDGLAGIAKEKGTIFSHPKTKLGILHQDVQHFDELLKMGECKKRGFSLMLKSADFFLELGMSKVRIYEKNIPYDLQVSFPVKAYYQNLLASVSLARSLEVPWPLIQEAAPYLKLPAMRFEKVEKKGICIINDAYNANPDSMKAALTSLPEPKPGGKKIAVLSEMDALGAYSETSHQEVALAALDAVDLLFCIGTRCESMRAVWEAKKKPIFMWETKEKLEEALCQTAKPGDVVLLKGARAYGLETLLECF